MSVTSNMLRDESGGAADLLAVIAAGALSQAIGVAAELGIPDALKAGPADAVRLATTTSTDPRALQRLLQALASLGLVTNREDGCFGLTASGALLCRDAPQSLHAWSVWWARHQWPVWGNLRHSITTGTSARRLVTGGDDFAHLARDPDAAAVFHRAMAEFSALVSAELVRLHDFSSAERVVDIGGGYGTLLIGVMQAFPQVHGVLFDLAHAIEGARRHVAAAGLAGRCDLIIGDFFAAVPADAQKYLLKAVLHDWTDEQCLTILRNCRTAITAGGQLLVIERVLPRRIDCSRPHQAVTRADLNMLVSLGGRERSEAEYAGLLDAAGFALSNVSLTRAEYSILEAHPV
jgi:hypothetical protein